MDQRVWFSEEPCFGHDSELGVNSPKKRRKSKIKWGQTALFLALASFGAYCFGMVSASHTYADFARWLAGFILSEILALTVLFYDNRRRHRRGRYGTYD